MQKEKHGTEEKSSVNARKLAHESLCRIEKNGRYSNIEVDVQLRSSELPGSERALYTRLVYGVIEKKITLDHIISGYSSKPVVGLDSDVLNAIRLGIYQLVFTDRIPEYSAVNESVGLVRKEKRGYVNAILRSFMRDGKRVTYPEEHIKYLSVRYSVSEPLVKKLIESLGDSAESYLEASGSREGVDLRINTILTSAGDALRITGGKISDIAPDVIRVRQLDEKIREGLEKGLWFVQDEASRIASAVVGAKPGDTVVDTCSCPGGKSFSMAIDMHNSGVVHSYDIHGNKLTLVQSGAERLKIDIIRTEKRDAREPDEALFGAADRVLCDAPCSGFGVISKKPEIRYKDVSESDRLPDIQLEILEGASKYVKKKGTLVYSTCTVIKAENEGVVGRFLERNPDFHIEDSSVIGSGMRMFRPDTDGCDGFFVAKMIRD